MQLTVSEAASQLEQLLQRAEDGDDIVITRNGHTAVKLVPVELQGPTEDGKAWSEMTVDERLTMLRMLAGLGNSADDPEPSTGNHDFLYDEDGLPA